MPRVTQVAKDGARTPVRSTSSHILSLHCLVLPQTSYLSLEIGKALSHLSKGSSGAHPLRPAVPRGAFPFRQQGESYCIHSEERSPPLAGDSLSVAPPHASQLCPFCVPLLVQERLCNPRFCVLECKVFHTPIPPELSGRGQENKNGTAEQTQGHCLLEVTMERVVRKAVAEKVGFGGAGTYWWGKFGERKRTERLRPDGQEDAQSLWHRILLSVLVVSALPQASSLLTRPTALAPNSYLPQAPTLGPPRSTAESFPSHAA